jgi:signal transduction histidine kinase
VLAGDIEQLKSKGESKIAGEIEQVSNAMRRHVDRELARARTAAGSPGAICVVSDVVKRVIGVASRTPDGSRLQWKLDIPLKMVAQIDPDDLAEAIGNLVENAARYAKSTVAISARREGANIVIAVRDDGPGIPEKQLRRARERGGRLDSAGNGAGLGLAIVADIAEAWGGHFEIGRVASGLEVVFRIAAHEKSVPDTHATPKPEPRGVRTKHTRGKTLSSD